MSSFISFCAKHVIKCHKTPLTLKSGKKSHLYVNWRQATQDTQVLNQLCHYIINYIEDKKLPMGNLIGVPEGGTKIALITSFLMWQKNPASPTLVMGRSKPKEHGDPADRFFIGSPREDLFLIEDVLTTGGSLIEYVKKLKSETDYKIGGFISLTNRSAQPNLIQKKLNEVTGQDTPLYIMSDIKDIAEEYFKTHQDDKLKQLIMTEIS